MVTFNLDWRFAVAFGATVVSAIFASKMDGEAVERVSIHAIDAVKESVIVREGDC